MAAAGGLDEVVVRTGSRLDPVRALAKLIFWLVMLVVILLASTALGLESINQMFGTMLAFIPTLIAGIVIVILGHDPRRVRARADSRVGGHGVRRADGRQDGQGRGGGDRRVHGAAAGGRRRGDRDRRVHPHPRRGRRWRWDSRSGWAIGTSRARSRAGGTRRAGGGTGGAPTARARTRRRATSRRSWTERIAADGCAPWHTGPRAPLSAPSYLS